MFYVNYVIFLPLFAEKNPNKVANFFYFEQWRVSKT